MKKILEMGCIDTGKYDNDISSNVPGHWTASKITPEEAEQLMGNVDVNDDTMAFADRPSVTADADFLVDDELPDLPDVVEDDKLNAKKTRKKK